MKAPNEAGPMESLYVSYAMYLRKDGATQAHWRTEDAITVPDTIWSCKVRCLPDKWFSLPLVWFLLLCIISPLGIILIPLYIRSRNLVFWFCKRLPIKTSLALDETLDFLFVLFLFFRTGILCISGCPGTQSNDEAVQWYFICILINKVCLKFRE